MLRTSLSAVLASTVALGALLPAQEATRPVSQIAVPGTDAAVRIFSADGVAKSAVSRDGGQTWTALPDQDYRITMRTRAIDPKAGDPIVPPLLMAARDNELFFVQFETDIIPEYLTVLERMGAELSHYVPNQTYIVRMPRVVARDVGRQQFVRAVLDYHPAYRLEASVADDLITGNPVTARYNIMMANKRTDGPGLEQAIVALGGEINMHAEGGILIEATLTLDQLLTVANDNRVLYIDRWGKPSNDVDLARIQAGVNYVENLTGLSGKGVHGHIVEGVYATHPELAAIPPFRTAPQGIPGYSTAGTGHGTNTSGEIYARGVRPQYRGLLPFAQLYHTAYSGSIYGTMNRYPLTGILQDPTEKYKVMIQTASWGYPRSTQYTSRSAEMDDILFDFPRLFVTNSQSNAGARPSRPQAWAKNVAGIGGFNHRNNTNPNDDCWCNTGSTGPADDNRVGPSFAAYYDSIGTISGRSGYTNSFGGTSGATPIVNGLAGGAIELYGDGYFGYPAVPVSTEGVPLRFATRPNLTTTFALLTLGTRQLDFFGGTSASRYEQGWGFPNLQDLYDNRNNILILDEEDVLTQGESRTYYTFVKPATEQFRASMAYLEDEAVPFANPTRINSVDLIVQGPGGTYFGNGPALLAGPWSEPNREPNDRDTHENVFLLTPTPGLYAVTVQATGVRADQHLETAAMDVDFALGIRGIGGGRDRSGITLDIDSAGPGQLTLTAGNVPSGSWASGVTLLSFDTARHVSLGNVFGLEADSLALAILSLTPTAGDPLAFTSGGTSSQYPSAPHSFPAPVAIALSGMELDGVVVLFDASGQVVDVSNVDRVQVQ